MVTISLKKDQIFNISYLISVAEKHQIVGMHISLHEILHKLKESLKGYKDKAYIKGHIEILIKMFPDLVSTRRGGKKK